MAGIKEALRKLKSQEFERTIGHSRPEEEGLESVGYLEILEPYRKALVNKFKEKDEEAARKLAEYERTTGQSKPEEGGIEETGYADMVEPYKKVAIQKLREMGVPELALNMIDFTVPDSPFDFIPTKKAGSVLKSDMVKSLRFPKVLKKDLPPESQVKVFDTAVNPNRVKEAVEKKLSKADDEIMEFGGAAPTAGKIGVGKFKYPETETEKLAQHQEQFIRQQANRHRNDYNEDLVERGYPTYKETPAARERDIKSSLQDFKKSQSLGAATVTSRSPSMAYTTVGPGMRTTQRHEATHVNFNDVAQKIKDKVNEKLGGEVYANSNQVANSLQKEVTEGMVQDRGIKLGDRIFDPIQHTIEKLYDLKKNPDASSVELIPWTINYLTNKRNRLEIQSTLRREVYNHLVNVEKLDKDDAFSAAVKATRDYDNKLKANYKKTIDQLNQLDENGLAELVKRRYDRQQAPATNPISQVANKPN
jgi:hypothetical protein